MSTAKAKVVCLCFCGILSGIAGNFDLFKNYVGNDGTVFREGYEMNAISAAVIYGVSMTGMIGNNLAWLSGQ